MSLPQSVVAKPGRVSVKLPLPANPLDLDCRPNDSLGAHIDDVASELDLSDNESSLCQGRFRGVLGRARSTDGVGGRSVWLGSGSDFAEEPVCRDESRPRWLMSRFLVSSRTLRCQLGGFGRRRRGVGRRCC